MEYEIFKYLQGHLTTNMYTNHSKLFIYLYNKNVQLKLKVSYLFIIIIFLLFSLFAKKFIAFPLIRVDSIANDP